MYQIHNIYYYTLCILAPFNYHGVDIYVNIDYVTHARITLGPISSLQVHRSLYIVEPPMKRSQSQWHIEMQVFVADHQYFHWFLDAIFTSFTVLPLINPGIIEVQNIFKQFTNYWNTASWEVTTFFENKGKHIGTIILDR